MLGAEGENDEDRCGVEGCAGAGDYRRAELADGRSVPAERYRGSAGEGDGGEPAGVCDCGDCGALLPQAGGGKDGSAAGRAAAGSENVSSGPAAAAAGDQRPATGSCGGE